jgi:hypothetical protein
MNNNWDNIQQQQQEKTISIQQQLEKTIGIQQQQQEKTISIQQQQQEKTISTGMSECRLFPLLLAIFITDNIYKKSHEI